MALSRIWPVLLLSLLLSGCSDDPTEREIRAAVEAHTRKSLSGRGTFSGFTDFRKQGCVDSKQAPGHFDCYYSATLVPEPSAKPLTVNGKARFKRTDKGLTFQDLGAQPR